jgi:UDP-MurNAc hydroxylase
MTLTTLEWLNHAGFSINHDGSKLANDPWLEGSVFNKGWGLLLPSKVDFNYFDDVTHLWISHEHPDHFCPHLLKKIGSSTFKKILLTQKTKDRRVINFCKASNFNVIEMELKKRYNISKDFYITNVGKFPHADTTSLIEVNGINILNINDCGISQDDAQKMKKQIGKKIDVLMCQFNYANWQGREQDLVQKKQASQNKINTLISHCNIFEPKFVIPFASFIYFNHEENFSQNAGLNRVSDVVDEIKKLTSSTPVVMTPGDVWDFSNIHNTKKNIEIYDAAFKKIKPDHFSKDEKAFSVEELKFLCDEYLKRIRNGHKKFKEKISLERFSAHKLSSVVIELSDNNEIISFDFNRGIQKLQSTTSFEVSLHSSSLAFLFKFDFGADTLQVNARFNPKDLNAKNKFFRIFSIGAKVNNGNALDYSWKNTFSWWGRRQMKALKTFLNKKNLWLRKMLKV